MWRSVTEKTAMEPSLAGGVGFRQVVRKTKSHPGRNLSMKRPLFWLFRYASEEPRV